ncbi:MAG: hypothetical protein IJ002_02515 [Clostridia bacterium]|nr:hypothetical protein [Clostridia bacterium]
MTFLIQMTVYLTVTATFILLLKRIFKNSMPAKWHVYIWVLLLIRLCIPSLPQSELSVFNAVTAPEHISYEQIETVAVEFDTDVINESSTSSETVHDDIIKPLTPEVMVCAIWLVGGALLLIYFAVIYFICFYRTKRLPKAGDNDTLQVLDECKKKTKVKQKVEVLTGGDSAMLVGVFKPKIILPQCCDTSEKRYILTHELCHLKNFDVLIIWFAIIFLCANWFNPIMWCSFFTLRRDIEVYCDERVLTHCENKKEYATLLLRSALAKNRFIVGTTSLQNGENEVKFRIKHMAFFKKPKFLLCVIIAVAVAVTAVLCLTDAMPSEKVYHADGFSFTSPTGKIATANGSQMTVLDMYEVLDTAKIGIVEYASGEDMSAIGFVPKVKGLTPIYSYDKAICKQQVFDERMGYTDEITVYYIEYPNSDTSISAVLFFRSSSFTDSEINKMLESFEFDISELHIKTMQYLQEEISRVFSPYYEILDIQISRWEESDNSAVFICSLIYKNYYKDPDTVGYIKEAKENGNENYEYMKLDYLSTKQMNFTSLKVILEGDTFHLYKDSVVNEGVWLPFKFDDCIIK